MQRTEPRSAPPSGRPPRETVIHFNQGQALLQLAKTYPTLLEVLLEVVQNALDEGSTWVRVHVNYKTRHLSVRDNCNGATVEKFNAALATVATPGRKGKDSLGQFGIGLISPLGKCERFTFVSCPAPQKYGFNEWVFETDLIVSQASTPKVPLNPRNDLTLDDVSRRPGTTCVSWRSELQMIRFTEDEFTSRVSMDALVGGIQERYGAAMRKSKAVISVKITDKDGKVQERPNVTGLEFRGRPLDEVGFKNKDAGAVMFKMFIAPRTKRGRSGKVLMGVAGNDFRVPFYLFSRAVSDLLGEEPVTALSSGLFEGEILCEKVTMNSGRKSFEKNDALIGLCIVIQEWWDTLGKQHAQQAKEARQDERWQDLGLRSMQTLEKLLRDPGNRFLLDAIGSFKRGTVGPGHTPPGVKEVGKQDVPSIAIGGNREGNKGTSDGGERGEAEESRPTHRPGTVAGPKGKRRTLVKSDSLGLQFAHEQIQGSDLWKLDADNGILVFNIGHPLFLVCNTKSDQALMKLQECVAIQALTLHAMPEDHRLIQRKAFDEFTRSLVSWILECDRIRASPKKPVTKA